jgi:hypothetical protein
MKYLIIEERFWKRNLVKCEVLQCKISLIRFHYPSASRFLSVRITYKCNKSVLLRPCQGMTNVMRIEDKSDTDGL